MTAAGLFGKLPAKGDFVGRGLSAGFQAEFEAWLARTVEAARLSLGDDFRAVWDAAPVWRFWIGPGAGMAPCAGVMAASRDRVGRRYPLAILIEGGPAGRSLPLPPVLPGAGGRWFETLEAAVARAMDEDFAEDPAALLAPLRPPERTFAPPEGTGGNRPRSHWEVGPARQVPPPEPEPESAPEPEPPPAAMAEAAAAPVQGWQAAAVAAGDEDASPWADASPFGDVAALRGDARQTVLAEDDASPFATSEPAAVARPFAPPPPPRPASIWDGGDAWTRSAPPLWAPDEDPPEAVSDEAAEPPASELVEAPEGKDTASVAPKDEVVTPSTAAAGGEAAEEPPADAGDEAAEAPEDGNDGEAAAAPETAGADDDDDAADDPETEEADGDAPAKDNAPADGAGEASAATDAGDSPTPETAEPAPASVETEAADDAGQPAEEAPPHASVPLSAAPPSGTTLPPLPMAAAPDTTLPPVAALQGRSSATPDPADLARVLTRAAAAEATLLASGRSYWWTDGNAGAPAAFLALDGLPDGGAFAALLGGFRSAALASGSD